MASRTARAAPGTAPDSLLPSLTADGMSDISETINAMSAGIAQATGTGTDRTFRSFRTSEVAEITGLTDRQVREWRREHKDTIVAYAKNAQRDGALPQMPLTMAEMHRMMADLNVLPRRPAGARAIRMGCFNFKGGSCKSSSALNLAVWFAMKGWRTLAIDADPQGSLSTMFGFSPEDVPIEHTLMPALQGVASQQMFDSVALSPLSTHISGLDIIPANLDMIGADFDITAAFMNKSSAAQGFYNCVDKGIRAIEDRYDIIFIDGAPAFSFTSLATMWAADGMIIPVPPASPDFKATAAFCSMAGTGLQSLANRAGTPDRTWCPVMFLHNRVKGQSESARVIQSLSMEAFGRLRCAVTIPDSSVVPNALSRQMSIWEITSSQIDSRGLRNARQAYAQVGEALVDSIRATWDAGQVREVS